MAKHKHNGKHDTTHEANGNGAEAAAAHGNANGAANGPGNGDTKDAKAAGSGKLSTKQYEKALGKLQVELCHLQAWVKAKGLRVIVIFEGRDGAGKGGSIRAMT